MMFNEITVDLDDVKKFVESPEFHRFLLNNTTEFTTAAFVLQTLMDAVESAAQQVDKA